MAATADQLTQVGVDLEKSGLKKYCDPFYQQGIVTWDKVGSTPDEAQKKISEIVGGTGSAGDIAAISQLWSAWSRTREVPKSAPKSTQVGLALATVGLERYSEAFYSAELITWSAFGQSEADADQKIRSVVGQSSADAAAILSLWKDGAPKKAADDPPSRNTEIGLALVEKKLSSYCDAFYTQAYVSWDKVDPSLDAVSAIIGKSKESGDVAAIVGLAKAAQASATKAKKEATKPSPVDLPAKMTIDLSKDTFTLSDGASYVIPSSFSVSGGTNTQTDPNDLTLDQWITLAKRCNLTYGINLEIAYTPDSDGKPVPFDALGAEPALLWQVPTVKPKITKPQSVVDTNTTSSESKQQLVRNSLLGFSLNVSVPFVSAAASAEREEKSSQDQQRRTLYMVGYYMQGRAQIKLSDWITLNPAFERAVSEALAKQELDDQIEAMNNVFGRFGHAYFDQVVFGGLLYSYGSKEVQGQSDAAAKKQSFSAGLNVAAGSVAAGGSVSKGDGESVVVTMQGSTETYRFSNLGGADKFVSTPNNWMASVDTPDSWQAIQRGSIKPLLSLLPAGLAEKAAGVWAKMRMRRWGIPDSSKLPRDFIYPLFTSSPCRISGGGRSIFLRYAGPGEQVGGFGTGTASMLAGAGPAVLTRSDSVVAFQMEYAGETQNGDFTGPPYYRVYALSKDGKRYYLSTKPGLNIVYLSSEKVDETRWLILPAGRDSRSGEKPAYRISTPNGQLVSARSGFLAALMTQAQIDANPGSTHNVDWIFEPIATDI